MYVQKQVWGCLWVYTCSNWAQTAPPETIATLVNAGLMLTLPIFIAKQIISVLQVGLVQLSVPVSLIHGSGGIPRRG